MQTLQHPVFSEVVCFLHLLFIVIPVIFIKYFDHFSNAGVDILPVL